MPSLATDPIQGPRLPRPRAPHLPLASRAPAERPSAALAATQAAPWPTQTAGSGAPPASGFLDSRRDSAWLGRTVGRYRILERLGRGGMASVFRARDPSIGRDVALKFLHAEYAGDAGSRHRFLQEARAAGGLSHPNVVVVHDVGELEGRPYIAMELCGGGTLAEEIEQRGALPLREAVSIALQLARALDHAHRRGIVHRDVKPSNVMRDPATRLFKLADFGIAHLEGGAGGAAGELLRTRAGDLVGTPQYMSPEQARGEPLDARSDLFSLGIVLYQLISGVRPFRADSVVGVATCIAVEPHLPLDELRGDVPRELRRLVDRCLAKRPAERFQTARSLVEALLEVRQRLDRGSQAWAWESALPTALRPSRMAGAVTAGLAMVGLMLAGAGLASLDTAPGASGWGGAAPALAMGALGLGALGLMRLWARSVTRPARQLAQAMAELARGRSGVRLGQHQGPLKDGEFAQLFAMFDSLAASLDQRRSVGLGTTLPAGAGAAAAHEGPTRPQ